MAGFKFNVYKHGFIIHVGFKERGLFHGKKDEENERNKLVYRTVKAEMLIKYPDTQRRC